MNWGPGYPDGMGPCTPCARCGGEYHASGIIQCGCPEMDEEAAEQITDLEKEAAKAISSGDWKRARECYEQCWSICEERE